MEIEIKNTGIDGLYAKTSGRLDLDSAVEYGVAIKDALTDASEDIKELVLDFSEITFISSFGLKVVLELYKEMQAKQGTLKLKDIPEQLKNSFKMVGFDKFLDLD
ncbi:STAS domain-containing protein [bacterium]|jgi:anti-anti-sigma factor|nr:STAS domain-containing protein [bacterium]